jgi:hypothetical protein
MGDLHWAAFMAVCLTPSLELNEYEHAIPKLFRLIVVK